MTIDLDALIDAIDVEFRAEFRAVIDQITLPIPQRVDLYTCWPGLSVVVPYEHDQRLELAFKSNPSKLRAGEHVYVNRLEVEPKDVISAPVGAIESIDENTRRCVIKAAFQQEGRFDRRFRAGDRIVLDGALPGERLGREQPILALRMLAGAHGAAPRLDVIREFLSGERQPAPTANTPYDPAAADPDGVLTPAQHEALRRAVETDFVVIQGPPGTGKTRVLGLAIRELVRRGLKVAVCSFTHQAINNVLRECLAFEDIPSIVKLGSRESWRDGDVPARLDIVLSPATYFRRKEKAAVVGMTQHAAFGPVARALTQGIQAALPNHVDVVVCDEAGQIPIPAAVMAMLHADRFIFAGDHKQLPPVKNTGRARRNDGMGSVFEHLVERAGHVPLLLDRTYRLNDALLAFPGGAFYGGRIEAAPAVKDRRLQGEFQGAAAAVLDGARPSVLGLVRHEGRGQESPEEAVLVADIVAAARAGGVPAEEIAVIAPHRRQNVAIRAALARRGISGRHPVVDTVERIQGQERDLVILSLTLSDADLLAAESDFLFLPNRFNVAITRARRKLIVLASPLFFRALPRRTGIEALDARALRNVNVLKQWYFAHKSDAVDLTARAEQLLARGDELPRVNESRSASPNE